MAEGGREPPPQVSTVGVLTPEIVLTRNFRVFFFQLIESNLQDSLSDRELSEIASEISAQDMNVIALERLDIDLVTLKDMEVQYNNLHMLKVELLRRWQNKSAEGREVSHVCTCKKCTRVCVCVFDSHRWTKPTSNQKYEMQWKKRPASSTRQRSCFFRRSGLFCTQSPGNMAP